MANLFELVSKALPVAQGASDAFFPAASPYLATAGGILGGGGGSGPVVVAGPAPPPPTWANPGAIPLAQNPGFAPSMGWGPAVVVLGGLVALAFVLNKRGR